ncbi:uncharacterized protein [Montipora foliosa]|uniref:uncharacterized protein n=1 Tax=Montipora foliosa TaxID=591990 RepID=UPI0035F1A0E8
MAETDLAEMGNEKAFEKVKKFLRDGCGCALGAKGGPCSGQFTETVVLFNLNNCLELSNDDLDLVVLTSIQAFTHHESTGIKRSRSPRCTFYFQPVPICKEIFLHLYGLSDLRFRWRKEHCQTYGICPRAHCNNKRLPKNTLSQCTVEGVRTFLTNYVEENAISLTGRILGFKNDDVKVLSSSESKIGTWRVYKAACAASDVRAVSYRKFLQLWDQFHPNVVISKPATDLCFTCQQNTNKLQRAANLSDREKSEFVKAHQDHLNCAQSEREYYRNSCINSENALEPIDTETVLDRESREACCLNFTVHYSFDYAQQVHTPSNPIQSGPIYFKTPRKCGTFGVMCEGLPRQVNFLIDEATTAGKGANATISYVHYYFDHHGLGETDAQLNADNWAGQIKNKYFLWYLAWRILMKLHNFITYSFLIAGHTKFAPDHSFGLIKKAFEVTYVLSLYEFARLVFYKELVSSPEQSFMLLKDNAIPLPPSTLPDIVNPDPDGLTEERRDYLFCEIRQFCKPGTEDIVAPAP